MQIHKTVNLDRQKLNPAIRRIRDEYKKLHGKQSGRGVYSRYDWARVSYAYDLTLPGTSILDVGIGCGQLVNALALSDRFERVAGLDISIHSNFMRLTDDYDIELESVDKLPFDDNAFDTILCMEVLEHVNHNVFMRGLEQLRRVCKKQLIMSVPFNEPLPLPSYHKQQFTDERIEEYFPDARRHLLEKPNVPWILLEERFDQDAHALR